jgi:Entner-Doudoroff aldolase
MSRHLSTAPATLGRLRSQGWVPVLRSDDAEDAAATALACGVDVVELTFSTPDVSEAVRRLVDEGRYVGVGTVRTAAQVAAAAAAGASFVVSFHRPEVFVGAALDAGIVPIPGALTPHEVASALDAGAPAVKLFPARLITPAYLGDLRTVLGDVALLVTGGIPAEPGAARAWLDAGAWCVGIGSQLGTVAVDGADEVSRRAAALTGALRRPPAN